MGSLAPRRPSFRLGAHPLPEQSAPLGPAKLSEHLKSPPGVCGASRPVPAPGCQPSPPPARSGALLSLPPAAVTRPLLPPAPGCSKPVRATLPRDCERPSLPPMLRTAPRHEPTPPLPLSTCCGPQPGHWERAPGAAALARGDYAAPPAVPNNGLSLCYNMSSR